MNEREHSNCEPASWSQSSLRPCVLQAAGLQDEGDELPWPHQQKTAPRKPRPHFPGKGIRRPQRTA